MGRGRQKAKQTKIARKLKYLTTDTNYDELAKELSSKEPGKGNNDPFSVVEAEYDHSRSTTNKDYNEEISDKDQGNYPGADSVDDDLDDYARWAAEAAAKATSGEIPVTSKPRKRIPIPVPGFLAHQAAGKGHQPAGEKKQSSENSDKNDSAGSEQVKGRNQASRGTEPKGSSTDKKPRGSASPKSNRLKTVKAGSKNQSSRKTGAGTKAVKSSKTEKKPRQGKSS